MKTKNICKDAIHLKNLIDEDFTNYRDASMFLGFPTCSFKCEANTGKKFCQNAVLTKSRTVLVNIQSIYERYKQNELTKAVVCGGLEPFDSFEELFSIVKYFRDREDFSTFVVYTGYYPNEILDCVAKLTGLGNIVIKYGRYIPGEEPHMDNVLGVNLASNNQYAVEYK